MSFKTATVTERMGVRDASYKLGKLAERLTLGHGPVESGLSDEIDTLSTAMQTALVAAGYLAPEPDGSARLTNGDAVTVTGGSKTAAATAAVTGNTIGGVTLKSTTDALVTQADAANIQDRNGVVLSTAAYAQVSSNKLNGVYFSALTFAISSDGNPLNVLTARAGSTVTGRVRLYVVNNQLVNVYLDGAAALTSGATVPVQNYSGVSIASGTVTVTNNVVSAVQLPTNYTAFADGRTHAVTDIKGQSVDVPVKVSSGNYVSQVLPATAALLLNSTTLPVQGVGATAVNANVTVASGVPTVTLPGTDAIVADAQVLTTADGGTVTLAIANGVITATYAAKAS